MVFLFGDTDPSFVEDWIGYYIDGKRAMKANVKLAALYQAPPRDKGKREMELKIGLRREEWRMYGSRDEFLPEDMGSIAQSCSVIATERAPYPGLRPFERNENDLFFGRDDCVDALVERLKATRFLAVLGSSGTGKSSLVKTGLLSALDIDLPRAALGGLSSFGPAAIRWANLLKVC